MATMDAHLERIEEERKALMVLVEQLAQTHDAKKQQRLGLHIEAQVQRLDSACATLQVSLEDTYGDEQLRASATMPRTVVELGADQRHRVMLLTGEEVGLVELDDPSGQWLRQMPHVRPPLVEHWAVRQVLESKLARVAAAATTAVEQKAVDVAGGETESP